MTIPRQAVVWDESRNSSQVRRPSPTAVRDALAACAAFRRSNPALAQWIKDGHPSLTEEEHVRRFGEPYSRSSGRR